MTHTGLRFHLPLPPATKALFLCNLVVFVANALLFGRLSEPEAGAWFAFSWTSLGDGFGLGSLRVLTYQFTHSFHDVMHLLANMLALWVFGPLAEARLGRVGTVRLYLWAGFVGACGHLLATALQGAAGVSLVGASGACYGLMVYAACTAPHQTIVFFIVQVPLWVLAALLTGIGAYSMFVELATGWGGGVAHSAHLGGALLGFVAHRLGWFRSFHESEHATSPGLWRRLHEAVRQRRAVRARRRAESVDLRLDGILTKVKTHGLGALRADERRFLERVSEHARDRGS